MPVRIILTSKRNERRSLGLDAEKIEKGIEIGTETEIETGTGIEGEREGIVRNGRVVVKRLMTCAARKCGT